MSLSSTLQTIKVDVEHFVQKLETSAGKFVNAFVGIFKKAPTALQLTENFVQEGAGLIEAAVAIADPALEPEVAGALGVAETALAGLKAAATAAVSGNGLIANLTAFAQTVPATLTSVQVKNPALQSRVKGIVDFITREAGVLIPAVENWIKQIAAQSQPATK